MEQRAEFTAATRKLIAQRAGFQCSVLNCGRLTVGPGPGSTDVIDIGVAAHIYAAVSGGPRGTGGLSTFERRSPENGIWCCFIHGKAIDSDKGNVFSAVQLKAWKRLHEARKGAELHGVALDRFGIIESISIKSAPASLSGRKFDLGMRNIISGPNGSGKTLLAKLIASVPNPDHVAEISRSRDVDIAVRWFDPNTHEVTTSGRSGEVRHILDGQHVPYVARPYKAILLSEIRSVHPDDADSLARILSLNITAMKATLQALPEVSSVVREVHISGSQVDFVLDLNGRTIRTFPNKWWTLPRYVEPIILVELAGLHAQHHARVEPTFLFIDEFLNHHATGIKLAALERLEQTAAHAQVAIITHSPDLVLTECGRHWTHTVLDYSLSRKDHNPHCPVDLEIETVDLPSATDAE